MKNNLSVQMVPFPARLMSSSRSPEAMSTAFAREILNMYALKNGAGAKRNGVSKVGGVIAGGAVIRKLMSYVDSAGAVQILAYTDDGKIYLQSGNSWVLKKSGLNTAGVIRCAHFAGKLIVCNGFDDVMAWDGSAFTSLAEWVKDVGTGLTYVSGTSFTVQSDAALYAVGKPVRFRLGTTGSTYVTSTVVSCVAAGGTLTVILANSVLTSALSELFYEAKPPAFSSVYVAHDRLWGFGSGALKAQSFSASAERAMVYYTFGLDDANAWRNTNGVLQYINLADKTPLSDELVAMAVKDGFTLFFFRNHTQIWSGTTVGTTGDFSWQKTVPLGAVHGDLVLELPGDVAFFTRFGVRTFSRVLQTEQLDVADMGAELDVTLAEGVDALLASDGAYKYASAFRHDRQGWFGFKLTGNAYIFQASGSAVGWSLFDGAFANATAFLSAPDGGLYLAQGGQVYKYDESVYADDGAVITTRWWMPWLAASSLAAPDGTGAVPLGRGSRWANKYAEVISDQGAAVPVTLRRYKNYDSSSYVSTQTTLMKAADYWDASNWDEALWNNGSPKPELVRDHFVADVFSYALESVSAAGPMVLFAVRLYGVGER